MKQLTSKNVHDMVTECLFKEGEDTSNAVIAESVMLKAGFHPGRLEKNKMAIGEMLSQLPKPFMLATGGGWSFLNACMTESGEHWGEHPSIDSLLALGIATDQAKILMPREMWPMFPGGLPYFVVTSTVEEV